MGEFRIVTTALSIARELWRYGEPDLADRAFRLSPTEVLEAGRRMGKIEMSGAGAKIWPNGPRNRAYLLGAIAMLEGTPRPCVRCRRLPEHSLPAHLVATEEQRWAALGEVSAAQQDATPPGRETMPSGWPIGWQQPAIDTVSLYVNSDVELDLLVGPLDSHDGSRFSGYMSREHDGKLRIIHDLSGRRTVYPWGLPRGPVLEIRTRESGRLWRVAYTNPDWRRRL